MPNRNPYEIRHSLLVDARQMLFRGWEKKCDVVFHNAGTGQGKQIKDKEMPEAPNFEEVLALAEKMDAFVSGTKTE